MKLKIVHQNQESRGGEEQVMKKEELELEETEEAQIHVSPENESTKENSPPPELSPISGSHPMLISGKRRRKPKELIDEVSPIIRRKKRKSSASKSKIGTPDSGGTLMSKKRRPKSLPLTVVQKKKEKEEPLVPQLGQPEEQSGNDSDEVASEVLEGTKFSGSSFHFKDVKSFEEFHIVVNGVCIDSELPEHIRRKYYELCCSKNAFLHDRVLPGLYSKLAAGMIVETINIADVIRGCKLNTPRKDFEVWEKSLRSFELLGLNVGFLRARLRRLLSLAFDTEGALEVRRYWETQKEQSRTEEEIQKLEAKLVELKELSAKYDHEIENLKTKAESYELKFQEEVDAPW
ncbi:UNVERIFIED_CONTAM: hypothetical protein Slati_1589900 [Sesamum latifolium]|uniref:Uncharacterized protein n=1 Tax=Sesamum latifolium TaxID=2727402 RepID=A0AAW2X9Z7_9LAMI